jgi:hypothetical protein
MRRGGPAAGPGGACVCERARKGLRTQKTAEPDGRPASQSAGWLRWRTAAASPSVLLPRGVGEPASGCARPIPRVRDAVEAHDGVDRRGLCVEGQKARVVLCGPARGRPGAQPRGPCQPRGGRFDVHLRMRGGRPGTGGATRGEESETGREGKIPEGRVGRSQTGEGSQATPRGSLSLLSPRARLGNQEQGHQPVAGWRPDRRRSPRMPPSRRSAPAPRHGCARSPKLGPCARPSAPSPAKL